VKRKPLPRRAGASATCSSPGAAKSSSVAGPSSIAEIERLLLFARTSSWTAGSSWRPAASRGKWRRFTSGGSLWVGPVSDSPSGVTVPRAIRRPCAEHTPANVRPSARQSSPNLRVISIWPSFLGKPCTQPRTSAKSRSTQM
jgi:hypothetical protein